MEPVVAVATIDPPVVLRAQLGNLGGLDGRRRPAWLSPPAGATRPRSRKAGA